MTKFQFKDGRWNDYGDRQNNNLTMAYMSGHKSCKVQHERFTYEVDFEKMTQTNLSTHKHREIRPPYNLRGKRPAAPLIPKGQTMLVKVPPGSMPGQLMQINHPRGGHFHCEIPIGAQPNATMMVPVPEQATMVTSQQPAYAPQYTPQEPYAPTLVNAANTPEPAKLDAPASHDDNPLDEEEKKKKGMGTGAKVAAGVAGVAAAGAITGAVLIEQGVFSLDDVGDFFVNAGEGIAGAAEDLGEAIVDLF